MHRQVRYLCVRCGRLISGPLGPAVMVRHGLCPECSPTPSPPAPGDSADVGAIVVERNTREMRGWYGKIRVYAFHHERGNDMLSVHLRCRLSPAQAAKLKRLASRRGESKSQTIRALIEGADERKQQT